MEFERIPRLELGPAHPTLTMLSIQWICRETDVSEYPATRLHVARAMPSMFAGRGALRPRRKTFRTTVDWNAHASPNKGCPPEGGPSR
jgi:hypothetical protein